MWNQVLFANRDNEEFVFFVTALNLPGNFMENSYRIPGNDGPSLLVTVVQAKLLNPGDDDPNFDVLSKMPLRIPYRQIADYYPANSKITKNILRKLNGSLAGNESPRVREVAFRRRLNDANDRMKALGFTIQSNQEGKLYTFELEARDGSFQQRITDSPINGRTAAIEWLETFLAGFICSQQRLAAAAVG